MAGAVEGKLSCSSHPEYPHYCVYLQVLHRSEVQEWQVWWKGSSAVALTLDTLLLCLLAGAAPL
jgi:hypothetical protein